MRQRRNAITGDTSRRHPVTRRLISTHVEDNAAELDGAPLVNRIRNLEHHHQEYWNDRRFVSPKGTGQEEENEQRAENLG